jgi:hypothetical protein
MTTVSFHDRSGLTISQVADFFQQLVKAGSFSASFKYTTGHVLEIPYHSKYHIVALRKQVGSLIGPCGLLFEATYTTEDTLARMDVSPL